MSLLTPEDIAYLHQAGKAKGFTPEDTNGLLDAIRYESSGRPDIWGGKGNKYFGLIQFGPNERAQFGVDTQNPNARNQIDAAYNFLQARGYKPGMGLLDLYSTINAGSPGHYNASDRPGMTVAKHVAAMGGQATPQAQVPGPAPILASGLAQPALAAPAAVADAGETELPAETPQYDRKAMQGLLTQLMAQEPQSPQFPQLPQELPEAPVSRPRARGLAFQQLTVKTPRFSRG